MNPSPQGEGWVKARLARGAEWLPRESVQIKIY
jgi:hypothetical protein